MATIEQRLKKLAYKPKNIREPFKETPKSEDVVFFICEELKPEDFPEPFFPNGQVINLHNGVKFLTYCGEDQAKNINKNAVVIQKKLSKGDKVIYRAYLMEKDGFNIRGLFLEHAPNDYPNEKNGYNLNPHFYVSRVKEHYSKKEIILLINKILTGLTEWSFKNGK